MRRFVYSPKVWAYVKTGNTAKSIRDISTYLVAGSVNRRLNAASSAQLTIRNPHRIWTGSGGDAVFRPMDPITIYMQRAPGNPVQVFTGYLDRTPYYQMYPGTVTLKASCTLKRLLYTFFDPALPFTQQFMMQYGWVPNAQSGMMVNIPAELPELAATGYFTDSGIGSLMFATLNKIGGWRSKDIFIERLPPGLEKTLAKLFNQFRDDNDAAISDFETLLTKYLSPGEYGGGSGSTTTGDVSTGTITGVDKIIPTMIDIANKHNVPAEMVIATWLIEWPGQKDSPGNPHYGWFQMQTANAPYAFGRFSQRPPTLAETHDLGVATTGYCEAAAGWANAVPTIKSSLLDWAMKVQGVTGANNPLYPQTWDENIAKAKSYISQYGSGTSAATGSSTTTASTSSANRVWPVSKSFYGGVDNYGEANHGSPPHVHAGSDISCPVGTPVHAVADGTVSHGEDPTGYGHYITLDHGNGVWSRYGHLSEFKAADGAKVKVNDVIALSGNTGGSSGPHLHFEIRSNAGFGATGTSDPIKWLSGAGDPTGDSSPSSSGGSTTDTTTQVANPKAAAFAAAVAMPSAMEMAEALLLQGRKSLMNDKPLMPFVDQLATASLRQYQSLPDGRFFAFFPDYFGEFGGPDPYWDIRDIEILDGNIDLNDDELITHQFVVGDTIPFGGIGLPERLLSSGVVDIFSAFNAGGTADEKALVSQFAGKKGKEAALDFLTRFGARPNYYEAAMIRSPYFELFLAWQRFMLAWSKQFSTEFTFTFMPELYPGGKVGFPDHGIKMFIEEVTHSFDYTGGFTTSATLSAPSAYGQANPALTSGLIRDFS